MTPIDGASQEDNDKQKAEALQAAFAQREVTLQGQPQGGSDVPSHQNSDPVRRIGNSTALSGSYSKTSCTVAGNKQALLPQCKKELFSQPCLVVSSLFSQVSGLLHVRAGKT